MIFRRLRSAPRSVIGLRVVAFILGLTYLLVATDVVSIMGAAVGSIKEISAAFQEALENTPELILQDKDHD